MGSAKYETIDRKFLDTFYRECGREVTLAYTVLNQTNTWAITFFAVVMGPSVVGLVTHNDEGNFTFTYPNLFYWLYLIVAWGLFLRFMQRSALALSNMYRWNELGTATWEVAALPENHPRQPELNDKLVELVDRLMIKWQDPRSPIKIVLATLKLMYWPPLLIFLGMISWGAFALPRDTGFWIGVAAFVVWTTLEAVFFVNWNKSRSQALRGDSAGEFLCLFRKTQDSANITDLTDSRPAGVPISSEGNSTRIEGAIATLLAALLRPRSNR